MALEVDASFSSVSALLAGISRLGDPVLHIFAFQAELCTVQADIYTATPTLRLPHSILLLNAISQCADVGSPARVRGAFPALATAWWHAFGPLKIMTPVPVTGTCHGGRSTAEGVISDVEGVEGWSSVAAQITALPDKALNLLKFAADCGAIAAAAPSSSTGEASSGVGTTDEVTSRTWSHLLSCDFVMDTFQTKGALPLLLHSLHFGCCATVVLNEHVWHIWKDACLPAMCNKLRSVASGAALVRGIIAASSACALSICAHAGGLGAKEGGGDDDERLRESAEIGAFLDIGWSDLDLSHPFYLAVRETVARANLKQFTLVSAAIAECVAAASTAIVTASSKPIPRAWLAALASVAGGTTGTILHRAVTHRAPTSIHQRVDTVLRLFYGSPTLDASTPLFQLLRTWLVDILPRVPVATELVRGLCAYAGETLLFDGVPGCPAILDEWCALWADPAYLDSADTMAQASFAHCIAIALEMAPSDTLQIKSEWFTQLTAGVQSRLEHSGHLTRGAGLFVAACFSRRFSVAGEQVKPVEFEDDADYMLVLSLAAKSHDAVEGLDAPAESDEHDAGAASPSESVKTPAQNQSSSATAAATVVAEPMMKRLSVRSYVETGRAVVWETGVSSLSKPFEVALASQRALDDPTLFMAKKLLSRAPLSLEDAIAALTAPDEGQRGTAAPVPGEESGLEAPPPFERFVAALCTLPRLVRAQSQDIFRQREAAIAAPTLIRMLVNLDNRYNIPDFSLWVFTSMVSVTAMALAPAAAALRDIIFGTGFSEGARMIALDVLVATARELSGRELAVIPETPWEAAEKAWMARNVRHGPAPAQQLAQWQQARHRNLSVFSSVALAHFTLPIYNGIIGGGTSHSADPAAAVIAAHAASAPVSRLAHSPPKLLTDFSNQQLLAKCLQALAVFVECAERDASERMCAIVMPLAWTCRRHPFPGVRLAVLTCWAACIAAIHREKLISRASWLQPILHAVDLFDGDTGKGASPSESTPRSSLIVEVRPSGSTPAAAVRSAPSLPASSVLDTLQHVRKEIDSEGSVQALVRIGHADAGTLEGFLSSTTAPAQHPAGGSDDPFVEAAILSASGTPTVWDDVVEIVLALRGVVESEPDHECRQLATAMCHNDIILELTSKPMQSVQQQLPGSDAAAELTM